MKMVLDTNDFTVERRLSNGVLLKHKDYKYKVFVHTPDDGTDDIHFYYGSSIDQNNFMFSAKYEYCKFIGGKIYQGDYKFYWT